MLDGTKLTRAFLVQLVSTSIHYDGHVTPFDHILPEFSAGVDALLIYTPYDDQRDVRLIEVTDVEITRGDETIYPPRPNASDVGPLIV